MTAALPEPASSRPPARGLLALALALALVGCQPAPQPQPLVLGTPHLPATALVYVAERNGCLAQGPHPVVVRNYPSGRDAMAALRKGEVDVAVGYQTPFIFNAFEDPALRILTALHSSARASYLVARRDRGIRSAADLRGKRIGYPPRTSAEYLLRSLLAFEGLALSDVVLVEIAPADSAAELKAGRVDAVAGWSPHVDAAAGTIPAANRQLIYSDVYEEMSVVATRQPVRERHPQALQRLVRCIAEAATQVHRAPDGGQALAAQVFPQVPPLQLQAQWAEITHQIGLTNALLSVLTHEADWLAAAQPPGVVVPRFADLLAPEYLNAVAPETVTALRRH